VVRHVPHEGRVASDQEQQLDSEASLLTRAETGRGLTRTSETLGVEFCVVKTKLKHMQDK
jgi:hypothetical protein